MVQIGNPCCSPTRVRGQPTCSADLDAPGDLHASVDVVLPMTLTGGPIFEYACHEGNYGMEGILAGHRAEEAAAQP